MNKRRFRGAKPPDAPENFLNISLKFPLGGHILEIWGGAVGRSILYFETFRWGHGRFGLAVRTPMCNLQHYLRILEYTQGIVKGEAVRSLPCDLDLKFYRSDFVLTLTK